MIHLICGVKKERFKILNSNCIYLGGIYYSIKQNSLIVRTKLDVYEFAHVS